MRVIPPIEITDALLTSSTAAEPGPGETAWNAATSYALGQLAIRSTTHRVYEAVAIGVDAGLPESTPSRWLDVGPTNQFAMFDLLRNSATVVASPLIVVLTPGRRVTSIGLQGVIAELCVIESRVGGVLKYTSTQNLSRRRTTGWFSYFFGEFGNNPSVVRFDLPPFGGAEITVTLSSTSGNVSCETLVIGNSVDVGELQISAQSDALNFSVFERDNFGTLCRLIPRRSVPKPVLKTFIPKSRAGRLYALRDELNAVPALWSGLDDDTEHGYFELVLVFGIYKRFLIDMDYPEHAVVTFELEGY
jgi:hypothetical protein